MVNKKISSPSILSAIQKLNQLLTKEDKLKCIGIIFFAILISVIELLMASIIIVFAQVLNDPSAGNKYLQKHNTMQNLSPNEIVLYLSIIVGIVFLIKNVFTALEAFFQNFSIQKMCYRFKKKLLFQYAKADYGLYLTRNSSFTLQVVGGDSELAFTGGMVSLASILSESLIFCFLVGMIIYINPTLAIIIFTIGMILSIIILKILLPKFYFWGQRFQETGIKTSQNLLQFFHAFKEIVLLGKKEEFVQSYHTHSKNRSNIQAIQTATNSLPRMGIEIFFVSIFVLTISYLCLKNESPTQMMGLLSGYLYAGFRLMPGLNRIINHLNTFKSTIPAINRAYNEYTTIASREYYENIPELQFDEYISFKEVNFKYLNTKRPALSSINFKIYKGESIGVVGETGSGKSTFIDLVLGLLRPLDGKILIDDKYPVNAIQWHKKIGYVPQSIYLIDDSIEANIAFGEEKINPIKLTKAIEASQLKDFIKSLPKKSKTIIGERGIRLSGGERQRIAIARALYHNPEILIFDEATSALDNKTESRLIKTINSVSKNRTVIMIAHRLTTLKKCNRILQLRKGKIKSVSKYKELDL